jgi:hypothetical protein
LAQLEEHQKNATFSRTILKTDSKTSRMHILSVLRDYLRTRQTLSFRGIVLTIFGGWLLLFPLRNTTDIIAATTGILILSTLLLISGVTLIFGIRASRRITFSLLNHDDDFESGKPITLLLKVNAPRILPFFSMSLSISWNEPLASSTTLVLDASALREELIPYTVTFPHRGVWHIKRVTCTFGDSFGLTRIIRESRSFASDAASIEVYPPRHEYSEIPPITSHTSEGEIVHHSGVRSGDLIDYQPYTPALGMKRIVWKMFARSGILVSKIPERAVSPEGLSCLFIDASINDEAVADIAVSYFSYLESLSLRGFAGCLGMKDRPLAESSEDLKRLLCESVWDTPAHSASETTHFIDSVLAKAPHLSSVLFFCSRTREKDQINLSHCASQVAFFQQKHLDCTVVVIEAPEVKSFESFQRRSSLARMKESVRAWFFAGDKVSSRSPYTSTPSFALESLFQSQGISIISVTNTSIPHYSFH